MWGAGEWGRGLGMGGWGGLVVLVLGTMLEDAGELHVVKVAFLINGCLSVHLVHFLVCEAVTHGGEQLPKVVLVDETWGQGQDRDSGWDTPTLSPRGPPPVLADLVVGLLPVQAPRGPRGRVLQCFCGVLGALRVGAGYVLL